MNLRNPHIQQAILDIAASSESPKVVEACRVVIEDYLHHKDFEIEGPNEVISIAKECAGVNDAQAFNSIGDKALIASLTSKSK
jgi:hypothetical protein